MLTPPLFGREAVVPPSLGGTSYEAPAPSSLAGQFRHSTTAAWQHKNNDWTHLGHLLIIRLNCLLTQKVRKIIATLAVTSLVSPIWRLQRQVNNQSQYDVQSSLLSPQDVRILFVIRISRVENPYHTSRGWAVCISVLSVLGIHLQVARYVVTC